MAVNLNVDQILRLYDIETRQVHSELDHILRIRGMMALAFAAILSATLVYKQGLIAAGALIFLGAWWWEYIYARYMLVYVDRLEQLRVWLSQTTTQVEYLSDAYSRGYDHRLLVKVSRLVSQKTNWRPKLPAWFAVWVTTFFDIPRAMAYLAMALSPLAVAKILGFPWTTP